MGNQFVEETKERTMEFKIAYYYLLGEKIGRGAFGDIFRGTDIRTRRVESIRITHRIGRCDQARVDNFQKFAARI